MDREGLRRDPQLISTILTHDEVVWYAELNRLFWGGTSWVPMSWISNGCQSMSAADRNRS